ncbi:adenosylcobinamide amidohydrolase [Thermoactinomyces mirandus]|uniref:Adenosylcobinamide amidohydrolase n=1 Tax=Thermoactinomyces mirandus TaxID=2756294 RepID=A0A7W2ARE5_9BACL|nr:adenosylcobinamide amidohydrolase [Thermoactinomyces mirandus]MBA4601490.1 adenosylcobinamide amidohydrolase [Thermoactinomyces mirandus]
MNWLHLTGNPVSWSVDSEKLVIESTQPFTILSSAVFGSDQPCCKRIINRHVDIDYEASDPEKEIRAWLTKQNQPLEETVVLLTAARVNQVCYRHVLETTFQLSVFVTAGTGNAARAGESYPVFWTAQKHIPGTINTVILVDGALTPAAMAGAIVTATEAKTAALQDLAVKEIHGKTATGTGTDAIVIASTQKKVGSYLHLYAGLSSPLGNALGKEVYQAVKNAVIRGRNEGERG